MWWTGVGRGCSSWIEILNLQRCKENFFTPFLFLNKIISELDVIRALVEARISQNLTQKELAARTGIDQADISKLENGTRNPSLNLLKRLADGMGMVLRIEFVPMRK